MEDIQTEDIKMLTVDVAMAEDETSWEGITIWSRSELRYTWGKVETGRRLQYRFNRLIRGVGKAEARTRMRQIPRIAIWLWHGPSPEWE
jgi:hypothetical protein